MRGQRMLYTMNYVNQMYVEEAAEFTASRRRNPYIQCFAAAACLWITCWMAAPRKGASGPVRKMWLAL